MVHVDTPGAAVKVVRATTGTILMALRKTLLALCVVILPLSSQAAETDEQVSLVERSIIKAQAMSICALEIPSNYVSERRTRVWDRFCSCAADFTSSNVTRRILVHVERSGTLDEEGTNLIEQAFLACKVEASAQAH